MELRKTAGLTQQQVANALGVAESTIRRWEAQKQIPHLPLDKVKLFAHLYNCTTDELIEAFVSQSIENSKDNEGFCSGVTA